MNFVDMDIVRGANILIIQRKEDTSIMDVSRAKEISQLGEMKNVQYQGQAIYIQSVNENQETARIYPLNNPQEEKEVPVDRLIEQ
jgi:small acid-soluble spore protein H (minor)